MRLVTASTKNHSRIRPSDSASAITTARAKRLGRLATNEQGQPEGGAVNIGHDNLGICYRLGNQDSSWSSAATNSTALRMRVLRASR